MVTKVPAVDRAATILELLGRDPRRGFTVSELAVETGIHKATCHSTVMCLDELGFIRRDEGDKTYRLGPALIALGFAAAVRHWPYVAARAEATRLATELDKSCLISVRDGEELVVLDIVGDTMPAHLPVRIGRRMPSTAALGSVYYAWAPVATIEKWITDSEGDFDLTPQQRRDALATVRSRGYSLGGEHDFGLELDSVLRRAAASETAGRSLEIAMEIADLIRSRAGANAVDADRRVNFVIAPIFDAAGRVVMTLTLFGRPGQLTVASAVEYAAAVVAAADRVTVTTGGRAPTDFGAKSRDLDL